jgi:ubiquinone/menaquinone biosynthesis C-methylase UbiE
MNKNDHKQKVKESFDMASEGYDCHGLRFFIESAKHLIKSINLKGNEKFLDTATGTGHVAIAAAQELPNGNVIGIDISNKMLERAERKTIDKKLSNLIFKCCDIEDMGFKKFSFDVACCAFGIFLVPDMEKGLSCISKVVKPGGKLAMTSFTKALMEPLNGTFLDRLKRYDIKPSTLSWKRLDSPDKINELLSNSGFQDINIQSKQMGYFLKDSLEWWDILLNSGYRGLLNQLSTKDLAQFKNDHLQEVDNFADEEGIWLDVEVLLATFAINSH